MLNTQLVLAVQSAGVKERVLVVQSVEGRVLVVQSTEVEGQSSGASPWLVSVVHSPAT